MRHASLRIDAHCRRPDWPAPDSSVWWPCVVPCHIWTTNPVPDYSCAHCAVSPQAGAAPALDCPTLAPDRWGKLRPRTRVSQSIVTIEFIPARFNKSTYAIVIARYVRDSTGTQIRVTEVCLSEDHGQRQGDGKQCQSQTEHIVRTDYAVAGVLLL